MAHNAGVVVVVVVVREKNADLQEGRKSDKREMTDTRYRFFEGLEFGVWTSATTMRTSYRLFKSKLMEIQNIY